MGAGRRREEPGAAAGELAITTPLRFAVIGLGNIGKEHVKTLSSGAIRQAELVATCSRSKPPELPDTVDHFQDHRQLLSAAKPDVVIVATPTMEHKQQGLDVLGSGCHLLMEKPVGMNILEADAVRGVALQEGQRFGVMLNQRYDPAYRKIKSLLDQAALGPIQRIGWTLTHWYRPDVYFRVSDWRGTWRGEGGGLLLNQCIHNLDIFYWLFGMPVSVYGECQFGRYHDIEVDDEATAIMAFDDGCRASFVASTGEAPGSNQLDIVGEEGALRFDGNRLIHTTLAESVRQHSATTRDMFSMPQATANELKIDESPNQHAELIQDFVDAVLEKGPLRTGIGEAVPSIELANGILLSAWRNERLSLPLDRALFAEEFDRRLAQSSLRERERLDVKIDMSSSYR